ncbi:MAG: hypothetical protein M1823_005477 [Watsoniomyces obsoletus]|nr:MAG: hypothetical protein M1823_005477 [Watsoniomyces obsoletus]
MRTWIAGASAAWSLVALGVQGVEFIEGNHYKDPVKHLQYSFGKPGSYMEITGMDKETGKCESKETKYSGPLGVFAEELSFHVRGPCNLAEFAVVIPNPKGKKKEGSVSKRDIDEHQHQHQRRHGHHHFHKRTREVAEVQKRGECGMATATINGEVKTWANDYNCDKKAGATPAPSPASEDKKKGGEGKKDEGTKDDGKKDDDKKKPSEVDTSKLTGDWVRVAYYNAEKQTAEGLAFLGNHGGQGSGVFDHKFGNSLAYASCNAQNGAPSPQILEKDLLIPSNKEVIIMSDKKCEGGSCGFVREGAVAHHGFGGEEKAFIFRFKMPDDGKTGNKFENANMPAIWLLNAKIPRVGQYVKDMSCKCWPKCGELDLFEVLDPGNKRCISAVHSEFSDGNPDYFPRPVDKFITGAVIFIGGKGHIKILDDDFKFSENVSIEDIKKMI